MVDLIEIAREFLPDLPYVVVEALVGQGPYGPVYAVPVSVPAVVDQKRRLVRDRHGAEVVSETTVFLARTVACPVGSRITISEDHLTTVLAVAVRDAAGNPEVPEHIEAACL